MKVIKQGNKLSARWSRREVCGWCGSLLSVEYDDIFQTPDRADDDRGPYVVTYECPVCSVFSDLPTGQHPTPPPGGFPRRKPKLRNEPPR